MRFLKHIPASLVLLLLGAFPALAADAGHHGLNWLDFALRVTTVLIVAFILWKFAGSIIKGMVVGRKEFVAKEIDDLAQQKNAAKSNLEDAKHKVANLSTEYQDLVANGETQAKALRDAIVNNARQQAEQILAQAETGAEQDGKSEAEAIRAELAEQIVAQMQKNIRLSQDDHLALIDKSLSRLVLR